MQFLYSPDHKWNSCSVGFGADLRGVRQPGILRRAVESVTRHTRQSTVFTATKIVARVGSLMQSPLLPFWQLLSLLKTPYNTGHPLEKTRIVGLDSCCLDLHNRHSHSFCMRPRQRRTRTQAPICP
jgi:hypothetical protein